MKELIYKIMEEQNIGSLRSFAKHFKLPLDSVFSIVSRNKPAGFAWQIVLNLIKAKPELYFEIRKKLND